MDQTETEYKCIHESRWKKYFDFRETVNKFIASKETLNGHLQLEDEKLEKRLSGIENKMWGLLIVIIGFMITIFGYTVFK